MREDKSHIIGGKLLRKYIAMNIAMLLLLVVISACVERDGSLSSGDNESIKDKIKTKLIGTDVTYKDKRGEDQTYTINDSDIKTINETQLEGEIVWKVRIGDTMAWDYYFDDKGEKIVKVEQLFKT